MCQVLTLKEQTWIPEYNMVATTSVAYKHVCKVSCRVGKTLMYVWFKVSQLLLFFRRKVEVALFYIIMPNFVCECLEEFFLSLMKLSCAEDYYYDDFKDHSFHKSQIGYKEAIYLPRFLPFITVERSLAQWKRNQVESDHPVRWKRQICGPI